MTSRPSLQTGRMIRGSSDLPELCEKRPPETERPFSFRRTGSSAEEDLIDDDRRDETEDHRDPGAAHDGHRGDPGGAGDRDDDARDRAHGAKHARSELHRRDEGFDRTAEARSDVRRERGKGRVGPHTRIRKNTSEPHRHFRVFNGKQPL